MDETVFERRYGLVMSTEQYHELQEEVKDVLLDHSDYATILLAEKLLQERYPLAFLYLEVIVPELLAITQEWYEGTRPFANVSGAWEQLEVMLPVLERRLVAMSPKKPAVLVASVEGNEHALGARLLADLLTEAGYAVVLPPIPTTRTAILDAALERNPACVLLSISVPDQVEELQDTLQALRDKGYTGKIAAGGTGLSTEQNWETRGVDWAGSDPLEFIAWLDREEEPGRQQAA
jgi:methylmalonyl-CoA mutase cobalamin-binding subunit